MLKFYYFDSQKVTVNTSIWDRSMVLIKEKSFSGFNLCMMPSVYELLLTMTLDEVCKELGVIRFVTNPWDFRSEASYQVREATLSEVIDYYNKDAAFFLDDERCKMFNKALSDNNYPLDLRYRNSILQQVYRELNLG